MTTGEPWIEGVLETWQRGQRLSAVGPGPVDVHLDHARRLAAEVEPPEVAADIGTGAGIPGLALAGLWPHSCWLLLDASARRTQLVAEAVEALGWAGRVEVRHARAEDVGREPEWRLRCDLVVARLLGPPAVTVECSAPFVAPGGRLVVTEPPELDDLRWPPGPIAELGLSQERTTGSGARACVFLRSGRLPDRYPRRAGIPAKRPLW